MFDCRLPRVIFFPWSQNDDLFNGDSSFGRRGCFFHCAVAALSEWSTRDAWCKEVLQRGTSAANIWRQHVTVLEEAQIGIQSDGYVCVPEARSWIQQLHLQRFEVMQPIVKLLSAPAQCHSDHVPLKELGQFIDAKRGRGMRSVFLILVDGKWSVAVDGEAGPHLLHFDPHVADPMRLAQSMVAVLGNATQLVDLLLARKTYVANGTGIVCHEPCLGTIISCYFCDFP